MPIIGEIRRARDIGLKMKNHWMKYIWHACENCGRESWVRIDRGSPRSKVCLTCANRLTAQRGCTNHWWQGGRCKNGDGYVMVSIYREDPYYSMTSYGNRVAEHRLVLAKHLGRPLEPWEIVHHKNHIRDDNKIENLELITVDEHTQLHILKEEIKRLRGKITELGG